MFCAGAESWFIHSGCRRKKRERERALLKYCHSDPHSWDQAGF